MTTFWRGPCSLLYLRSWPRSRSMHPRVQFLPTAEASPGLPGAAWQLLAGHQRPAPNSGKLSIGFVYFTLLLLLLILLVFISKSFYIQFVSLSPFSSFSLPLVGGWGINRQRLSLSLLMHCFKPWRSAACTARTSVVSFLHWYWRDFQQSRSYSLTVLHQCKFLNVPSAWDFGLS